MSTKPDVLFISCVSGEFGGVREPLHELIKDFDLHSQIQEKFRPTGSTTLLKLDKIVQECTAVVHIVGETRGSPASEQAKDEFLDHYRDFINCPPPKFRRLIEELREGSFTFSYTQWEAYLAILHNKPLFLAVPDETFPRDLTSGPDLEQTAFQSAHLERLKRLKHYEEVSRFTNIHELAINIRKFIASEVIPLNPPFSTNTKGNPVLLLNAKYDEIPFLDFHNLRDEFVRWAIDSGEDMAGGGLFAARLLVGPGGCGKTRLAAEICKFLKENYKWHAGFLPSGLRFKDRLENIENFITQPPDKKPLLIIVDSAEGRMHEVKDILEAISETDNRTRLMLLARSDGEWWESAKEDRSFNKLDENNNEPVVVKMPAIHDADVRGKLFYDAADVFIKKVPKSHAQQTPTKQPLKEIMDFIKSDDAFNRPLFILIAAMTYSKYSDIKLNGESLLEEARSLEFKAWDELIGPEDMKQVENRKEAINRGVCLTTLVGGTESSEESRTLLLTDNHFKDEYYAYPKVNQVESFLSLLFPGQNDGLEPLQPDILGEYFVAWLLKKRNHRDLFNACLVWSGAISSLRRTDVLRVVNRSSHKADGTVRTSTAGILQQFVKSLGTSKKEEMATELVEVAISSKGELEQILSDACDVQSSVFSNLRKISHEIKDGEEGLKTREKEVALILGEICSRKLKGINVDTDKVKSAVALGHLAVFLLKNQYQDSAELAVESALSIAERVADEGDISAFGQVTLDIVQVLSELGRFEMAEKLAVRCEALLDKAKAREQSARSTESLPDSAASQPVEKEKLVVNIVFRLQIKSKRASWAQLQGHSDKAVAFRREAADLARTSSVTIGDQASEFILASEIDLSLVLAEIDPKDEEAKRLAESSTELIGRFHNAIERSTALNTLSAVHSLTGSPKAALFASNRALEEVSADSEDSELPTMELAQARALARRSLSIDLWNDGRKEVAREAEKKADDEASQLLDRWEKAESERQERIQQQYEERSGSHVYSGTTSVYNEADNYNVISHPPIPLPIEVAETSYDPEAKLIKYPAGAPEGVEKCVLQEGKLLIHLNHKSDRAPFPPGDYEFQYNVRYDHDD